MTHSSLIKSFTLGVLLTSLVALPGFGQVTVSTHHLNNSRTGLNSDETVLTQSNVNAQQFGKVASFPVDGQIYAQPLYVPDVAIAGKGTFNVLYVATMNNSIYAFNADTTTSTVLWSVNYNNAAAGVTPVPYTDVEFSTETDINGPIGIEGTPVIDVPNSTMYVLVRTKENGSYLQRLHAIDIRSGADLPNSPVVITGSIQNTAGTVLTFNPKTQNHRVAIVLANNMVYITWASHNDNPPYYGWIAAYNIAQAVSPLKQVHIQNDTKDGSMGGIWMAGSAPVIDSSGNLYYIVGNGSWNGTTDFGQSIIKVSPSLQILDYFTPDNWQIESNDDNDLGCGGLVLIPGTNFLLGGSKQGILYLTNITSMGHMVSGNTQIPQIWQAANGHIHSGPTYYDSPTLGQLVYIWSENDYLKAFQFNGTVFKTTPVTESSFMDPSGMPGGFMEVTSNGAVANSAILWVNVPYSGDAAHATVPGVLRAFNPNNLTDELWDTHINASRDDYGNFAKDVPPVVANGKVYMASFSNSVAVYGLLNSSTVNIQINTGGNTFSPYIADKDYTGGTTAGTSNTIDTSGVFVPAPMAVYQSERWGPSTYIIPGLTPNDTYYIRLHFAEFYWTKAGQRQFNVAINGTQVLTNFDIIAYAGAANKATAVEFPATANSSGQVVVAFTNGAHDNAKISAIEVSGTPISQGTIQVDAGGPQTGTWSADEFYSGGYTQYRGNTIVTSGVSNPAPQTVYQTERWGASTYTIPNLIVGQQYTVRLHFAEIYWTTKGQREFNVSINGAKVLTNFDIIAAAGAPNTAVVEQFTATANGSGEIVISFALGSADYPKISGIEIQ